MKLPEKRLLTAILIVFIFQPTQGQVEINYDFEDVRNLGIQHGLPDPFVTTDGSRVKSFHDWEKQKNSIKAMLAHHQYGSMPATPKNIKVEEQSSTPAYDGLATQKLYTINLFRGGKSVVVHFGMMIPSGLGPFPVIIKNDRKINDIPDEVNIEAIQRGYIMCQFVRTDLGADVADMPKARQGGIFPLYPEYSWGSIAAWAWGYSILIDYFEELEFIDKERIVATGHSRGGKTAFCAGIFEERIAITAPNSSGLGGTASHRYFELGMNEQTIGHASIKNPHWWTDNYFKLVGFETRIPFDAHFGKAVIAPRAFFNTHALQDYWANPFGTFITFEAAKKVYKWLGYENNIKMHWRSGGHAQNTIDWVALLDFCDFHFFGKKVDSNFAIDPYPTIKTPIFWDVPSDD